MSTSKKAKPTPAPEREQIVITLPLPGERVGIEHLIGGNLAGSLAVPVEGSVAEVVAVILREVELGGSLPDLERRAMSEYFKRRAED